MENINPITSKLQNMNRTDIHKRIEMENFDPTALTLHDCSYVGRYIGIDWNSIIDQMNTTTEPLTTFKNTPAYKHQWTSDPLYEQMHEMWEENNFNMDSVKWRSYYPAVHFDGSIVEDIAAYTGITNIHSFWISRVDPGFFAPIHCDPFIDEIHDAEKGELKRYAIFITPSEAGHLFVLGRDYLYNLPVGTVIKWNNPNDLHIGINGSLKIKYMINFLGY